MSYATLLQEEGIKSNFLVILKPARVNIETWTLVSGSIYKVPFAFGHVINMTEDGTALTEGSSISVSFGEWYYDFDNEELYVSTNTPNSQTFVITYELYFTNNIGTHWHRIPTDTTTRQVYYEPLIITPPTFKGTLNNAIFGFLPSQTSSVTIGNPDHILEQHFYAGSMNRREIDVYHWLSDDLDTDNIKKLITGLGGNISYSLPQVTINLVDRVDLFDDEWRNASKNFYNTTDFPNIDPSFIGNPIRYVAGRIDDIKFVNVDYVEDNPTTSDNRDWVARVGALNQVQQTVPGSPSSTTTRTYLSSVDGLNVGDSVRINKTTDEYVVITVVNRTSAPYYIEHATLASGAAAGSDTVDRGTISYVNIRQQSIDYTALYIRDYTESVVNGCVQITFTSSVEANLSINTLSASENVSGRVYGETNGSTIGGSPLGSNNAKYEALTDPVVIMYEILKTNVGIPEANINTSSFQTLQGLIGDEDIGFALPQTVNKNYPKYKTVLTDIMRSNLIKLFLDEDNKWSVDRIAPISTEDKDIEEDEVLEGSISYKLEYKDMLSDVIVAYAFKELDDKSDKETYHYDNAEWLYSVKKQKTFNTYLLESTDAQDLARRLGFIYGERKGTFKISAKNRFFDTKISDKIEVNLDKHLGFEYINGTLRARTYDVLSVDKGLRRVNITLNDQKGIEDNSGSY